MFASEGEPLSRKQLLTQVFHAVNYIINNYEYFYADSDWHWKKTMIQNIANG